MSNDIEKFIENLSKQDFVVFAGTGVVGGTGIDPSWKKLLEKFKEEEPECIKENIDEIDELEYPKIAQNIFNNLNEDRYYEILKNGLKATNAQHSSQETVIVRTAKHIVTTNFDTTFESAMDFVLEDNTTCSHKTQTLPYLKYKTLSNDYSISYLHGRLDEKHVVFKEDDYKFYYPSQFNSDSRSDVLEIFLRYIYSEETIVFIGFGFRDKYLLQALQNIRGNMERNDAETKKQMTSYLPSLDRIQHYACIRKYNQNDEEKTLKKKYPEMDIDEITSIVKGKKEDNENVISVLGEIGINVLLYDEHCDWMEWFEKIRKKQKQLQTSNIR